MPAKHQDILGHTRIAIEYGDCNILPGKAKNRLHPGFEPTNYQLGYRDYIKCITSLSGCLAEFEKKQRRC